MGWGVGVAVFGGVDGAGQCLVLAQVVVVLVGMCRQGRGGGRDAFEGSRPQRWPQKRLDRQWEEVDTRLGAVAVGYNWH